MVGCLFERTSVSENTARNLAVILKRFIGLQEFVNYFDIVFRSRKLQSSSHGPSARLAFTQTFCFLSFFHSFVRSSLRSCNQWISGSTSSIIRSYVDGNSSGNHQYITVLNWKSYEIKWRKPTTDFNSFRFVSRDRIRSRSIPNRFRGGGRDLWARNHTGGKPSLAITVFTVLIYVLSSPDSWRRHSCSRRKKHKIIGRSVT